MRPQHRKDSGFALLLVFLMAAVIAISLYMEIPRVAFESQRQKEQLLIERGEQYKRAIQIFYTTNKRWPARIEELESLNNKRFLRRRYKDPMTGKDEWRLIHVQNGVLTDSKVTKPQGGEKKEQSAAAGFITEQTYITAAPPGGAPGQGQSGVNLANRRRSNEGGTAGPGTSGMQGQPGMPPPPVSADPSQQQQQLQQQLQQQQFPNGPGGPIVAGSQPQGIGVIQGQPIPGQLTGAPGQQAVGSPVMSQVPGVPGMQRIPGQIPGQVPGQQPQAAAAGAGAYVGVSGPYIGGSAPAQATPVRPGGMPVGGYPGPPANSQTGGMPAYPVNAGASGVSPQFGQPGMNPQAQNAAAAMIQQILTQPRPGGAPQPGQMQGQVMGGGIAGFASNADDEGIMVYNDRTNYGEWEFIFDPAKMKQLANPNTGAPGTPAAQMGNMQGANPVGTPASQLGSFPGQTGPSPFGTTPNPNPNPVGRQ